MSILIWNIITGVIALAILALVLRARLPRPDKRFADTAPGEIPADPATAKLTNSASDLVIPAMEAPPDLPIVDAGLLMTGETQPSHVEGTLLTMAVKGSIRFHHGDQTTVEVIDAEKADNPYEKLIVESLPTPAEPSEGSDLSEGSEVTEGDDAPAAPATSFALPENLLDQVRTLADHSAKEHEWFIRRRSDLSDVLGKVGMILLIVMAVAIVVEVVASLISTSFFRTSLSGLQWVYTRMWPLLILLILALAAYAIGLTARHDPLQRSAMGRALTDQCEGFITYLKDIEIAKITGDKGVYFRYLPWALISDQVSEWNRTCALIPGGVPPVDQLNGLYADDAKPEGTAGEILDSLAHIVPTE